MTGRKPRPAVGFCVAAALAGLLPFLSPPIFPEFFELARVAGALLAGGAAAFEMRRSRPRGRAAQRHRTRVALGLLALTIPVLLLLHTFRVVPLKRGQETLAVPVGLWRQPDCCRGLDNVTCLRTRLNLSEGAIRKCWGDESVSAVRFGLVLSFWGTALGCGALIGLFQVREQPAPSPSYDLFLSYANEDRGFVERLATDLGARGLAVWWDQPEVQGGDSIVASIEQGLSRSRRFAVVLSPDSRQSSWVNSETEAAIALENERQESLIIPILYRACDVPVLLKHRKRLDFTGSYEQGLAELLGLLSTGKGQIRPSHPVQDANIQV
ncbi:MAG TPA: toll/interleukin-1 receptor domain-containing protein [Thermoanaerobaculia bacterium]|nr:toll/interleukin-1 receptor domain-containing protein [Thermoanaerobaculia bacterium]